MFSRSKPDQCDLFHTDLWCGEEFLGTYRMTDKDMGDAWRLFVAGPGGRLARAIGRVSVEAFAGVLMGMELLSGSVPRHIPETSWWAVDEPRWMAARRLGLEASGGAQGSVSTKRTCLVDTSSLGRPAGSARHEYQKSYDGSHKSNGIER